MYYGMKTMALSLFVALLALSPGPARAAELPSLGHLLERVTHLQDSIAALEDAGQINHGQATALSQKLDKVSRALSDLNTAATSRDVTAQQQQGSFLKELQQAINALLDFVRDLTKLVTDLPADVLQPIIDAAISLLQDLIGLLLA